MPARLATCPALAALLFVISSTDASAADIRWERIKVEERFRSEGVAAFDVNKDGKVDVVTREVWFEAPDWKIHEILPQQDYKDGAAGYSHSFANWGHDINGDGWIDLIVVDFPGTPCYWLENPKNKEGHWKQHDIWHSACDETPLFLDLTGDGKPELIMGSEPEGIVGYLEIPAGDAAYKTWEFVAVNPGKTDTDKQPHGSFKYYHGLGLGDVNHDGRRDIVIPHGWWEQPEKLKQGPWKWHPLALSKDGKSSFQAADIYVDDLDLDGDNDIMMSSAHQLGIWWFENTGTNAEPKFEYRLISEIVSQTHALHFADINGDGQKDLITGKRWWAHGPKGDVNPDADPIVVWFEIQRTKGSPPKFIPHVIAESSGSGIGTQFLVTDFNGDKLLDIVLSNKKGTNVLIQRRDTKAAK